VALQYFRTPKATGLLSVSQSRRPPKRLNQSQRRVYGAAHAKHIIQATNRASHGARKMRIIKLIKISQIKVDRWPMTRKTYELAKFIDAGGNVPPIRVQSQQSNFLIRDGRHRLLAHKLLGMEYIRATFSPKKSYEEQFREYAEQLKKELKRLEAA
jgi:hypothetical protein